MKSPSKTVTRLIVWGLGSLPGSCTAFGLLLENPAVCFCGAWIQTFEPWPRSASLHRRRSRMAVGSVGTFPQQFTVPMARTRPSIADPELRDPNKSTTTTTTNCYYYDHYYYSLTCFTYLRDLPNHCPADMVRKSGFRVGGL